MALHLKFVHHKHNPIPAWLRFVVCAEVAHDPSKYAFGTNSISPLTPLSLANILTP